MSARLACSPARACVFARGTVELAGPPRTHGRWSAVRLLRRFLPSEPAKTLPPRAAGPPSPLSTSSLPAPLLRGGDQARRFEKERGPVAARRAAASMTEHRRQLGHGLDRAAGWTRPHSSPRTTAATKGRFFFLLLRPICFGSMICSCTLKILIFVGAEIELLFTFSTADRCKPGLCFEHFIRRLSSFSLVN
jgi:hypothetical protein